MSFGFHYYETTNQSLTLQYFSSGVSPIILGKLRSLAAASSIASGMLIWILISFLDYRETFLIVGAMVVLAGIWGFMQDPTHKNIAPQRQKMILKKKYSLYYILTFLSGARRQIFMVFSVFLLVKFFHFTVQEMTFLFIINNLVAWILNPLIGKAIVKFGERRISSIEYIGVIIIFLVYAFTTSKYLAAAIVHTGQYPVQFCRSHTHILPEIANHRIFRHPWLWASPSIISQQCSAGLGRHTVDDQLPHTVHRWGRPGCNIPDCGPVHAHQTQT
jgi:uncharacterized membrane protein